MTVEKTKTGQKTILAVSGRIDGITSAELEKTIDMLEDDVNELVFDFENLEYTSSAGLRVLLKTSKMMQGKGTLKIINTNENIKEIFDMTGFSDILDIK